MGKKVGWKKVKGGYTVWADQSRTKQLFVKVRKNGIKDYFEYNPATGIVGKFVESQRKYFNYYGAKNRLKQGQKISRKIKLTKPKIRLRNVRR